MDAYVLSIVTTGTEDERLHTWVKLSVGHPKKEALWPRYDALLLAKSKLRAEYTEASRFSNFIMVSQLRDNHLDPVNLNHFHHASVLELECQKQRLIVLEKGTRTVLREIFR